MRRRVASVQVLQGVLIALVAVTGGLHAAHALNACSAADIIAQDPGCPAGTGPCSITKQFTLTDGCDLDFGTRAVTIAANAAGAVLSAPSVGITIEAGSLVIAPGGFIDGRGQDPAGMGSLGGTIDIETTGAVTLQKAVAGMGRIDVSATVSAGGIIINAGGTVTIAGSLDADRLDTNSPGGDGGTIQITTDSDIITQTGSLVSALGGLAAPDGGGEVDLTATGKILLSGTVDIRGSAGGTLNAQSGDAMSVDTLMGNATGDAGDGASIAMEAGTSLTVTDQITASGSISPTFSGGGFGGTVSLTADFGDIVVVAGSGIHADGADPDGDAGEIDLFAQGAVKILKTATATAHVTVSGGGPQGGGGLIDIEPNLSFQLDGAIDASGGIAGGEVDVTAGTDVTLNGIMDISGRGYGSGGGVASIAAGDLGPGTLTINNLLDVSAFPLCDPILGCGVGGTTSLQGCNVIVTANGTVNANSSAAGSNGLLAYEQLTINGIVKASKTTTPGTDGTNTLDYPSRKPAILAVNAVKPSPVQNAHDTCTASQMTDCLLPCPTCGNGIVEFPEECDNDVSTPPTLPKSCDGCSAFCQLENCDDGRQCTTDSCDQRLGCRSVPVTVPCTEGPSPTPTITPTVTQTPTVSATPTTSPTPTITLTPTRTPTPSVTPTFTLTLTLTPTTTATPTPALPYGCAVTPIVGCRTPGISSLRVVNSPKGNNKVSWRWRGLGGLTSVTDFGNPVIGAMGYRLCIYDTNAGVPALKLGATAPTGGLCKLNKPCWKPTSIGYHYFDGDHTPDGLATVALTAGVMDKAKISVSGVGPNVVVPAPIGTAVFKQDSTVTVQFVRSDGGLCWESVYSTPAKHNLLPVFKDTLP